MKWLQILGLLIVACLAGCGPNVPGPSGEPVPDQEDEVIDEALEAEANAAAEEQ